MKNLASPRKQHPVYGTQKIETVVDRMKIPTTKVIQRKLPPRPPINKINTTNCPQTTAY